MIKFLKKIFGHQPEYFVSDAEKFLYEFDKTHPKKSDSQLREMKKHERVAYLRDHVVKDDNKNKLWEGF
jgi:uncharacterized protein YeaO (DUF488 family)